MMMIRWRMEDGGGLEERERDMTRRRRRRRRRPMLMRYAVMMDARRGEASLSTRRIITVTTAAAAAAEGNWQGVSPTHPPLCLTAQHCTAPHYSVGLLLFDSRFDSISDAAAAAASCWLYLFNAAVLTLFYCPLLLPLQTAAAAAESTPS